MNRIREETYLPSVTEGHHCINLLGYFLYHLHWKTLERQSDTDVIRDKRECLGKLIHTRMKPDGIHLRQYKIIMI